MKTENIIAEKSYAFSLRIIEVYKKLTKEKNQFVIGNQLLRSGTSIGANVEEAIGAISRKEFIAKLQISYKEARETHYWLRLLRDSNDLDAKNAKALINDCEEILKILTSILKSTKSS